MTFLKFEVKGVFAQQQPKPVDLMFGTAFLIVTALGIFMKKISTELTD